MEVKPKFNFDGVDTEAIDPDKIDFGSQIQDCAQITSVFERGAHSIASEAAVFAPLTRSVQNNKKLAQTASDALTSYVKGPDQDEAEQSLNFGTQKQGSLGASFGEKMLELARECIPCDTRIVAMLELHPNIDLLSTFENHLKVQLENLSRLVDLLADFDIYGDFCEILNALNDFCIPDLQRIVAILMALMLLDVPNLDDIIGGMLQALIMPLFAPILLAVTALLDKFSILVSSPIECIIASLNYQLRKFDFEKNPATLSDETRASFSQGLNLLTQYLTEGKLRIDDKLRFYISQVKAMMGELSGGDAAYLGFAIKKLRIVRLIAFVLALIKAMSQGHAVCSDNRPPEISELDNFFQTYLNPYASFDLYVDIEGRIHINEPSESLRALSETGNVVKVEGAPLVETIAETTTRLTTALTSPIRAVIPCRLETTSSNIDKVNDWISELNK